ncbi:MAG: HAD-IIIA family hydrolase [Saprospiraceae bacterium]|nr:HAD-IIIA family hydrolase [Saprospiraceae bacterium]
MRPISFHKKPVKFLVLDVDGVLTDGGMYLLSSQHAKKFNVKDGLGIKLAHQAGILVGIISASKNNTIITTRAKMLNIPQKYVSVGNSDKLSVLEDWLNKLDISLEEVAYIGDDITDIPVLEKVGVAVCPNDAVKKVKAVSEIIVLEKNGGEGCVREFIDEYLLD